MLIQFSTLVLTSQLLIMVADNVPNFNIEKGCKVDNANASGLNAGLDETTKNCIREENTARNQLQSQWSQFAGADRVMCTGETTDSSGVPPSYVELLTCLQLQLQAKKIEKVDK